MYNIYYCKTNGCDTRFDNDEYYRPLCMLTMSYFDEQCALGPKHVLGNIIVDFLLT